MILNKFFRLYAPEPGDTGSVDRGDNLPEDNVVTDVEDVKDDPKVKELKEEIDAEAEEAKDEEPKAKKDSRIPLSRHKEILEKEREQRASLERQLAQYQNGQQVANVNEEITALENNVLKLEKEYANLLTDGEIDKACATASGTATRPGPPAR